MCPNCGLVDAVKIGRSTVCPKCGRKLGMDTVPYVR